MDKISWDERACDSCHTVWAYDHGAWAMVCGHGCSICDYGLDAVMKIPLKMYRYDFGDCDSITVFASSMAKAVELINKHTRIGVGDYVEEYTIEEGSFIGPYRS